MEPERVSGLRSHKGIAEHIFAWSDNGPMSEVVIIRFFPYNYLFSREHGVYAFDTFKIKVNIYPPEMI